MKTEKPECIVIDGSSFLFRAFFATQRAGLTSRKGFPTGAVLSFSKMIRSSMYWMPSVPQTLAISWGSAMMVVVPCFNTHSAKRRG